MAVMTWNIGEALKLEHPESFKKLAKKMPKGWRPPTSERKDRFDLKLETAEELARMMKQSPHPARHMRA